MECGNRLRVGVRAKTLACRGLRVGPSKLPLSFVPSFCKKKAASCQRQVFFCHPLLRGWKGSKEERRPEGQKTPPFLSSFVGGGLKNGQEVVTFFGPKVWCFEFAKPIFKVFPEKAGVAFLWKWKTDFYTVVILILWRILLQNVQPQRQWCIKILLPWAQKFYAPLVLGRGVKVSVAIFSLQRWCCIKSCFPFQQETSITDVFFSGQNLPKKCPKMISPHDVLEPLLGRTFWIFYFFSARGGEGGARGAEKGGDDFLLKIPGGGSGRAGRGGGGGGRGGCLQGIWGRVANIFFGGPKGPPSLKKHFWHHVMWSFLAKFASRSCRGFSH